MQYGDIQSAESVCNDVDGSLASVQPSIDSLNGKLIRSNVSAPHKLSKAEKKMTSLVIMGNLQLIFLKLSSLGTDLEENFM